MFSFLFDNKAAAPDVKVTEAPATDTQLVALGLK